MAPVPQAAEVYNTDRFAELYYSSQTPTVDHLALASRFLLRLFQEHGIRSAFLGGWAVYLRGGPRMTQDVDIVVAASMNHLKTVLLRESRLCVPEAHGQTCIQIFVHTGVPWDQGSTSPYTVSVDAVIQGNLGTPANLMDGIADIVPVPEGTHIHRAPVLDVVHQFRAKLQAHANRRSGSSKDFQDLQYLIHAYLDTITATSFRYNLEHRLVFFEDWIALDPTLTGGLLTALGLS